MKKNKRGEKELTLTAEVLIWLFAAFEFVPRPFGNRTVLYKRRYKHKIPYNTYLKIINRLEEKGLIKIYKENHEQLLSITKKGELEALFQKARFAYEQKWDRKWRMVVFDIPEYASLDRRRLRQLLKINGYKAVQKSVYINPYPLNREAIRYLHDSGLDKYVRLFRIDETDCDLEFKKLFNF